MFAESVQTKSSSNQWAFPKTDRCFSTNFSGNNNKFSFLNHFNLNSNTFWIDLRRPPMTTIPMTSNDFKWLPMTTNDYRWLPMTIRWLSDDNPMTIGWLSNDYPMTIRWLSNVYLMTIRWLSDDSPTTIPWLSDDYPIGYVEFSKMVFWLWSHIFLSKIEF